MAIHPSIHPSIDFPSSSGIPGYVMVFARKYGIDEISFENALPKTIAWLSCMISFGEFEFNNANVPCLFKHVARYSGWRPEIDGCMDEWMNGHSEWTCLNKQWTLALSNSTSPKDIMQDNHVIVFVNEFSKEISSVHHFMRKYNTSFAHYTCFSRDNGIVKFEFSKRNHAG